MGEGESDVQVAGEQNVAGNTQIAGDVVEGDKGVDGQQAQTADDRKVVPPAATEAVEAEPKLTLTVAGPCNNPAGLYVGLSKAQRDKLGVDVGGQVELRKEGRIVGIYTVALGKKELLSNSTVFTANAVTVGDMVEVVKATSEGLCTLPLSFGVETAEKHQGRGAIIRERFGVQGFDGEAYIVLPTGYAKLVTGQTGKATIATIALGKIKVGGILKEFPIVPAGEQFGMTSSAAKILGIPGTDLENVEFYISDDGVLVINRVS